MRLGLSCGLFYAPLRLAPLGVEPESAEQEKEKTLKYELMGCYQLLTKLVSVAFKVLPDHLLEVLGKVADVVVKAWVGVAS